MNGYVKDDPTTYQVEKGNFTRIHNGILERLALTDFSGYELKCLIFLLRQTYGHRRKDVRLSLKEWEAGTKIDWRNVDKVIKRLRERNIVVKTGGGRGRGNIPTYSFNKYFDSWDSKTNSYIDTNIEAEEIRTQERVSDELNSYPDTKENSYSDTSYGSGLKKERKEDQISLPREKVEKDEDETSLALVRDAYHQVGRMAPATITQQGRDALGVAMNMIEKYGFANCHRMIDRLKEQNLKNVTGGKKPIAFPMLYLLSMMEDARSVAATSVPVVMAVPVQNSVSFTIKDLLK